MIRGYSSGLMVGGVANLVARGHFQAPSTRRRGDHLPRQLMTPKIEKQQLDGDCILRSRTLERSGKAEALQKEPTAKSTAATFAAVLPICLELRLILLEMTHALALIPERAGIGVKVSPTAALTIVSTGELICISRVVDLGVINGHSI